MTVAFFAALGLPGLSGFISEAFSLLGSIPDLPDSDDHRRHHDRPDRRLHALVLQRVFLGTLPDKWKNLPDMNGRETLMLASLGAW